MTKSKYACRVAALLYLPLALGCNSDDEVWRARLADPDPNVRRAAVHDVASTVESTTAVPILTAALQDTDDKVKVAATLALLRFEPGNLDCRPVVERALDGGQGPVFVALGASGEEAKWAVPKLVTLMKDRRTAVRALAAKTLGEIGVDGTEVDAALQRGMRDKDSSVQNASQQALKRLRSKDANAPQR